MPNLNKIALTLQALSALLLAWRVKFSRDLGQVRFECSDHPCPPKQAEIRFLISMVDLVVRWGTLRTGRKCFFRSYIIGSLLNSRGVPLVLNIGLRKSIGPRVILGHCWLTLDSEPFAEHSKDASSYPFQLGNGPNGIVYWFGARQDLGLSTG